MRAMKLLRNSLSTAALCGLLVACGSSGAPRSYKSETFPSESPFLYYSSRQPALACEVAKRALLSQGYQIDDGKPLNIRGDKFSAPASGQHPVSPSSAEQPRLVITPTRWKNQYEMKSGQQRRGQRVGARVGHAAVGGRLDTLVKIGETVTDRVL
jgi:hypothetical protein